MRGDLAATIASAVRNGTAGGRQAIATAIACIDPAELATFFHARLDGADAAGDPRPIGHGLPASPGAATGAVALTADEAMRLAGSGTAVILVRRETTPDDVMGMQAARGILTSRGGMVSHAAVVARGWGIPAVVGATDVRIEADTVTIGADVFRAGDEITIDGTTGSIYRGALAVSADTAPPELATLLSWADTVARGHVTVRANADTHGDATVAKELGAQGIGLCRTEHMFLAADRLPIMRRFILADDPAAEADALAELEAAQIADFESVLEAMEPLPVTVRLLDPPLHEFLPDLLDLVAREARGELDDRGLIEIAAVRRLHESNPMIGTRGVRLGIVRRGVYEMQVRALCTAAANLFERGKRPQVEIMIPLVVEAAELRIARRWVTEVLDAIGHPELSSTIVTVGVMIETPRAALIAAELAEHADFFSFGTNDLTQLTYAFSRDDVESRLLPSYQALGILPANPFAVLDQAGVGELVRIGCEAARARKPTIELGVCGEHAGDPASAAFLVRLGVDSVSCSPFRVPMARLGVAQALLACGRVDIDDVDFDHDGVAEVVIPAAVDDVDGDGSDHVRGMIEIDETLVLHVLRVRGFVTPDGFGNSLGSHPAGQLTALIEAGLVRHIESRDMFGLLPAGRERSDSLLDGLADPGVRAELAEPYERFLALNDEFKRLCTTWQMRDGSPNDHSDPEHDRHCIADLTALADRAGAVIDALAAVIPRLGRYRERLSAALACVAGGDTGKFTGVMCESFHDIWMELHEDLIVMLRIDRAAEGSF
jgi:phosphoenolpyruvate-protein kinase (PTS system EI component)